MDVIIIGAGRWSVEVMEVLQAQGHAVIGWLDDRAEMTGRDHHGVKVLGTSAELAKHRRPGVGVHVAIGSPEVRVRVLEAAAALGFPLVDAIHPTAVVMPSAKLGGGDFIGPNAVVSSCCELGRGVVVHMGCSIGHHSRLEDGAFLGSGVSSGGGIVVGRGAFICPGVTLVASVNIGAGAVVSAGLNVAQPVPAKHCLTSLYSSGLILTENIDWPRVISGVAD